MLSRFVFVDKALHHSQECHLVFKNINFVSLLKYKRPMKATNLLLDKSIHSNRMITEVSFSPVIKPRYLPELILLNGDSNGYHKVTFDV